MTTKTPAKRVRTSKVPENETNAQKFVRLANARTGKALDAIAALEGLTSKINYDYSAEQWSKIMQALEGQLTKLGNKIKNPAATVEAGFALD